jgi:hypothetical protein
MPHSRTAILGAALLLSVNVAAPAGDNARGAVQQSTGNSVPQTPTLPRLSLSGAQREQIRKTLLTKHTEVEFQLKESKAAKDFNPQVGAPLPKGLKADGLPSELTQQIPQLADYGYVKMKDQILLINELNGKVAEIIPETQPQTTGQQ